MSNAVNDDAQFCSPIDFWDPSKNLTLYDWLDESLYFYGYAGLHWPVIGRTLFWNFLNTDLQISLPSDVPPYMKTSDGALLDTAESWTIVPTANLPFEVAIDYSNLTPGTTEYVLSPQIQALSSNGTVLCSLPPANLTCIVVALETDENHLGKLLAVGWTLLAIIWATCILCFVWMYMHRKIRAVKVLQPLFLGVITLGVAILGGSIVPLSLTDENASVTTAQHACQATPWTLVLGFTLVFSALFSKLWRINKIFQGARQYRKLRVTERDVMGPFLFWFLLNSLILTLRTILAPADFERVDIDDIGADSIATCQHEGTAGKVLYVANVVVTLSSFFAAAYQAYRARNVSDEYAESKSLWMAIFIWAEILAIGVPVIFLVGFDSPTTSYFVAVAMIFGLCLSMLGAIYVPLWRHVRTRQRGAIASTSTGSNAGGRDVIGSHESHTGGGGVHVTGVTLEASTSRGTTADRFLPHMSVALGSSEQKSHSAAATSNESASLLERVQNLEQEIIRLRQRNQELERMATAHGETSQSDVVNETAA